MAAVKEKLRSRCCCGRTMSSTTMPRTCRPRWCTRRFAALRSSTRSSSRAGARCWRWCRATTTTRSASASASGSMSTTWSRSPPAARLFFFLLEEEVDRDFEHEGLAAQAGRNCSLRFRGADHGLRFVVEDRAAGAFLHRERGYRAVLADRDAQLDPAFPVVVLRDARIFLVAPREVHKL